MSKFHLIIEENDCQMNILILGSGGREHALAWKIAQSKRLGKLFVAPGNAGTAGIATNISVEAKNLEAIKDLVVNNDINMVVVGPEAPLVNGITDFFTNNTLLKDVMIIGPASKGSKLEGSKDFAKAFMKRYNIPTARYKTFTKDEYIEAVAYLETQETPPYVIKADGLAAGKGVSICENLEDALKNMRAMLLEEKFGEASERVVIEQFLKGIELSVFVLTDGKSYQILPAAKDYKRIGENDTGPNTGGMGSVSPVPFAHQSFMKKIEDQIIKPTIAGLQQENIPFKGFIFFGLMNVNNDPYVVEYNVRMGDPEAEVVLPRIKSDMIDLLEATWNEELDDFDMQIDNRYASAIILASGGYPGKYEKGKSISGVDDVNESIVFHAGTKLINNEMQTNGGRVMAITGLGNTLQDALLKAYQDADKISFDGKYFRKDIGKDLMK